MKTFQELIFMKRCIEWLISRKASITLIPFDIIEHHILNKLDWFSSIRFLYVILPFYYSEDNFMKLIQYNFLLGDVYQNINMIPLRLIHHNHPYSFEAHVVCEWSPFSHKNLSSSTVAVIKSWNRYPFYIIDFRSRNIERLVWKQIKNKILQLRLSIHINYKNNTNVQNLVCYPRRNISLHIIPFSIQVCDVYMLYDALNEKISMKIIDDQIYRHFHGKKNEKKN